jgi:Na+/melibiose symporter-like transporter
MTRFDIRVRRKRFTQSRIERHKDFQNLMGNYDKSSRKKTSGVIVLVFMLILIIAILLAFLTTTEEPSKSPKDKEVVSREHVEVKKKNSDTVYKL